MFIPETIDLGKSEKYDLSIRIRPDGFKFSISDPESRDSYCLRETTFSEDSTLNNIQRIIFDLNFLTQQYRKTNVIIVSKNYDIIPQDYFIDNERLALYSFTHSSPTNHLLSFQNIHQQNVTLFDIDTSLYEFLMRSLYNPAFMHHTNSLISGFQNKANTISLRSRMFVNFHDDMMDIISFSPDKLILCQTYQSQHPMNQLYYILKSWEYCNFNQQTDWLYIIGNPTFEITEGIKKYIVNIEVSKFFAEDFLKNEEAQRTPLDLLLLTL